MYYLFIGPGKTGSTWLYKTLLKSSLIECPIIKETNVLFDLGAKKSVLNRFYRTELNKVDFSNTYIYDIDKLKRIKNIYGNDVRIIIGYRSALSRVESMYKHDVRSGIIRSDTTIDNIIRNDPSFRLKIDLAENIRYVKENFDHVILWDFEKLETNDQDYILSFLSSLGVTDVIPDLETVHNIQRKTRFQFLSHLSRPLAELLRRFRLYRTLNFLKYNALVGKVLYSSTSSDIIISDIENKNYLSNIEAKIRAEIANI